VTLPLWAHAERRCPRLTATGAVPNPALWFHPPVPPGSVFDAGARLGHPPFMASITMPAVDALHLLAPYQPTVSWLWAIRRFGENATAEEMASAYGPLLDYDVRVLRAASVRLARFGRDASVLHERACALEADECLAAGAYFAARGRDAEALRSYERAIAEARDRVGVANDVDWIVDYYLEHGREADARRVANVAAGTYSSAGLGTLARLLERMSRLDEAHGVYQKIRERYEASTMLDRFYVRQAQRTAGARYAAEAQAATARLFPGGLQKVTSATLPQPPRPEGIRVVEIEDLERLRAIGVRPDDILMAVDGYRVLNVDQWLTVRSFTDAPQISVIVFRGGGYLDLSGPYTRYKWGR
jgi:hypothetical protein